MTARRETCRWVFSTMLDRDGLPVLAHYDAECGGFGGFAKSIDVDTFMSTDTPCPHCGGRIVREGEDRGHVV